jgi:hypothetical protein
MEQQDSIKRLMDATVADGDVWGYADLIEQLPEPRRSAHICRFVILAGRRVDPNEREALTARAQQVFHVDLAHHITTAFQVQDPLEAMWALPVWQQRRFPVR